MHCDLPSLFGRFNSDAAPFGAKEGFGISRKKFQ